MNWYVPLAGDAPVRLFAFPHAGAGCAQFAGLAKAMAPEVALWAANLPGRQGRLDEPPPDDLTALVETLAGELAPLTGTPYALFGYCGGALLALLVARGLRDRRVPSPTRLVVASFEAPDIARLPRGLAGLPSEQLWQRLAADGGTPPGMAADPRLRRVAEGAVRADFALLAGYRHTVEPPLEIPVTVCFGHDDPAPRGAWLGWQRQTVAPPELRELSGGHWLLDESPAELADVLRDAVATGPGAGTR